MNHLAKHFYDYQSYINLPHHALQMHKTPPSQAGSDPSAAWAPKDLHTAGKNQAAPAARAARNYHSDQRTGSHRHGRPSKLEFRNWGERHGELRAEKIVPHQEHLLHGHVDIALAPPQRRHTASGGVDNFPSDYFPARHFLQQRHGTQQQMEEYQQQRRVSVLVILTMAPHFDFVTVTVKSIRGMGKEKMSSLRLRFFDGPSLVEERVAGGKKSGDQLLSVRCAAVSSSTKANAANDQIVAVGDDCADGSHVLDIGESFLLRVPSPLRLPFCHINLSFYSGKDAKLMGNCQLGPTGSASRGTNQWKQMIKKMGVPIAAWHPLNVPDACASSATANRRSPSPDECRHTVPRRRTTVSVPTLTVGALKVFSTAT